LAGPNFFRRNSIEIVFVVFSVIDRASFDEALRIVDKLESVKGADGLPLVYLIGNKIDLVNATNKADAISSHEAEEEAMKRNLSMFFMSAKYVDYRRRHIRSINHNICF
jgi:GTPase SAR1 family protein